MDRSRAGELRSRDRSTLNIGANDPSPTPYSILVPTFAHGGAGNRRGAESPASGCGINHDTIARSFNSLGERLG